MDLETTGGEALARLQELLPELDRAGEACEHAAETIDRVREDVESHFEQVEDAAQALCHEMRARRADRAPRLQAEGDALDALWAAMLEHTRMCQKEAHQERLEQMRRQAASEGVLASFERREIAQQGRDTGIAKTQGQNDRLRDVVEGAPLVVRAATEQVAAFRERIAARAEAVRAFMVEECLARLEERVASFVVRLEELQERMAQALSEGGGVVSDATEHALAEGLSAFASMSDTMAAGTDMWDVALGGLAGSGTEGTEGVGLRQETWAEATQEVAKLFEDVSGGFGEMLEAFGRLSLSSVAVPSPFGPIPIPFPNFGR